MGRMPDLSKVIFNASGEVVAKFCPTHDGGKGAWLAADQFSPRKSKYVGGLNNTCRACVKAALFNNPERYARD